MWVCESVCECACAHVGLRKNDAHLLHVCYDILTTIYSMPNILQILEQEDETVVREWGVACASLEEVFLDVTKKTGFEYATIDDEEGVVDEVRKSNCLLHTRFCAHHLSSHSSL